MTDIPIRARARQSGFTLAEMAVSLFVTVSVLLGVLMLFDFTNKLSRVQGNVADMQQSLRIAQHDVVRLVRMAGRGGLPVGNLPAGLAVAVRNNVGAGERIGGGATPAVLEGTDVLTVRGVFAAPIYRVTAPGRITFNGVGGPGGATSGSVVVPSAEPANLAQDLEPLRQAIAENRPEALVLIARHSSSVYAVVELDPAGSSVAGNQVTVAFHITGGQHAGAYRTLSPGGAFPATLTTAAYVGILEEYRLYVREEHVDRNDDGSDLTPKLSRARVYPATDAPYAGEEENWQNDIADNIVDLQVALGLDSPNGGCTVAESEGTCTIFESEDGTGDDWLLNDTAAPDPALLAGVPLHYLRLSTLARTDRRDVQYQAPLLVRLEDHDFAGSLYNEREERMFRRRLLQTVIDMRNL
ncbi:MAG TPA: hypothetical protein VLQ45_11525 [Thermoanaerobaculia bacterium]|nr:hypothetical protein [Thermoanaerobaculia bacterium]